MKVIDKFLESHWLSKPEYMELLQAWEDVETAGRLRDEAVRLRKQYYGNKVFTRGLIEFTNYCKNNCYYCGIRGGNSHVKRYRLTGDEILECCKAGYELGYRTFVLQGGEDAYYTDEKMAEIIYRIKKEYPDCILFYRLGDFYEMFFEDALTASKALDITLTGRDCGLEERAPMCGVPHHACDVYLKKLIEKGYNVAICEQTMDPAMCKGIVPREVIRVVTPGTLIESSMLDETSNNYICAFYMRAKESALCLADISTGEVHLFEFEGKEMTSSAINELSRFSPAEILINDAFLSNKELSSFIREKLKTSVQLLEENDFSPEIHTEEVLKQFSTNSLESIGIKPDTVAAFAVCGLFAYIHDTQKALVGRFSEIIKHDADPIMTIGFTARRNLELTETLRNKEKKGSLLWVLDHTKTSMGKRMLKSFPKFQMPNRQDIIDSLRELMGPRR